jgi:hypothetical protein
MTPADFLPVLEAELRSRPVAFDAGELLAFVEGAWSLIQDDPDPVRWAEEFLAAWRGEAGSEWQ